MGREGRAGVSVAAGWVLGSTGAPLMLLGQVVLRFLT